jgi:hypothetical protein
VGRTEDNLNDALDISVEDMLSSGLDEENADDFIQDIHREMNRTPDSPNEEMDQQEIDRYNKRRQDIAKFKETLQDTDKIDNKDWAQQILKNSTHNMLIAQKIAIDEIEEDPMSKKITSLAELSNAITSAAKTMIDIDNDKETLEITKEKNILRRMEVESKLNVLDGQGMSVSDGIGSGSTEDMLKLLESESDNDS